MSESVGPRIAKHDQKATTGGQMNLMISPPGILNRFYLSGSEKLNGTGTTWAMYTVCSQHSPSNAMISNILIVEGALGIKAYTQCCPMVWMERMARCMPHWFLTDYHQLHSNKLTQTLWLQLFNLTTSISGLSVHYKWCPIKMVFHKNGTTLPPCSECQTVHLMQLIICFLAIFRSQQQQQGQQQG